MIVFALGILAAIGIIAALFHIPMWLAGGVAKSAPNSDAAHLVVGLLLGAGFGLALGFCVALFIIIATGVPTSQIGERWVLYTLIGGGMGAFGGFMLAMSETRR